MAELRIRKMTPDLMALRPKRVDFVSKVHDLTRFMTLAAISEACNKGRETACNWHSGKAIPRHDDGEMILTLHRHFFPGEK